MSWDLGTRSYAYRKCQNKLVSKIVEAKERTVIWVLEDWGTTWKLLRKSSACTVDMGEVSLLFSLSNPVKIPEGHGNEVGIWLPLCVQPQYTVSSERASMDLSFKFQVDELTKTNKYKIEIKEEVLPGTYFTINGPSTFTLKKQFIKISTEGQQQNLMFGIFCSIANTKNGHC